MYFISVDCGGTKSAFLITDEKGNKLASLRKGPGNYLVSGLHETIDMINEGIDELCNSVGCTRDDIAMAMLAMPAYTADDPDPELLEETAKAFKFNYVLCNDVTNGLTGSLLDNEGIHLISGTGSIGMGSDGTNVTDVVGGWGYYCGADEGSGYWIACNLIRHFEMQQDGREEKGLLFDYLSNKYNLKTQRDGLNLILGKLENKREKIATMTMDCVELAHMGDETAKKIFYDAGYELGRVAKGLYNKSNFKDPVRISYSGSIFKSIDLLRDGMEDALKDIPHHIEEPILEPLEGGIIYAMKQVNHPYDEQIINNLKS